MAEPKTQKQNYRNFASRFAGYIANMERPKWLPKRLIKRFKKKFKIDLKDFDIPENGFKTFNSFFTRKFKVGVRAIEDGIVSPVDGIVFDYGHVDPLNQIHVKFKHYYIDDLIFEGIKDLRSYAVLYLSPSHYHRVHACFDMQIDRIKYLPGTLRSVREKVVGKKNRVYCRNERIVIHGKSQYGKFYFILVGAMFVGKVKLSFESGLETNIKKGEPSNIIFDEVINIKKGEELGYFEMGSSVIILLENKNLENILFNINDDIRVGQKIAD